MPEYKVDMQDLPQQEDIQAMIKASRRPVEQSLVAFLYLTGARPAEAVEVNKADFKIIATTVTIEVPTKKLGEGGKWCLHKRTLTFNRNILSGRPNEMLELLVTFVNASHEGPLWHMKEWNVHHVVKKLSMQALGRRLCPYIFRHNAITLQSRRGATLEELMAFKGSKDVRSVSPYLHAKPHVVRQEVENEEAA